MFEEKRLNLQFFANGAADDSADEQDEEQDEEQGDSEDAGTKEKPAAGSGKGSSKLITTEEMRRIAKKEKTEGRLGVFKALGIDTSSINFDHTKAVQEILDKLNAGKTDAEKAKDAQQQLATSLAEQNSRLIALSIENKLIRSGIDGDSALELVQLIKANVKTEEDIDDAIASTKKKFPKLFEAAQSSSEGDDEDKQATPKKGTGRQVPLKGGSGGDGKTGSYGERLAKSRGTASTKESSYFGK